MKIWAPICSATTSPLQGDRTARRSRDAGLQSEIRGVLGRVAEPAPPQDGPFLDEVVEPGLADLARRDGGIVTVVCHRANEGERPGDVVIGDDERHTQPVMDVVVDVADPLLDRFVGPALDRAPEVHADELPEHAGVDPVARSAGRSDERGGRAFGRTSGAGHESIVRINDPCTSPQRLARCGPIEVSLEVADLEDRCDPGWGTSAPVTQTRAFKTTRRKSSCPQFEWKCPPTKTEPATTVRTFIAHISVSRRPLAATMCGYGPAGQTYGPARTASDGTAERIGRTCASPGTDVDVPLVDEPERARHRG